MVEQRILRTFDEFMRFVLSEPMFAASNAFKFFTIWVFVLVCLHRLTYKYVNLLALVWVVLVFSLYFSYISPGYFAFDKYVLVGTAKLGVDVLFHWLPAAFITWMYWSVYKGNGFGLATSNALLLFLVYLMVYDVREVYKIERVDADLVILFIAVILVYLAIFRP